MFADEPLLDSALQSIYEANADEITRQKCQAREEYNRREKLFAEQDEVMKKLTQQTKEQQNLLAEKDKSLSQKDNEILALRKLLKQNGINTDSLSLPEDK